MNQLEKDEFFIPASEDEAIEVECLLVEPQHGNVSVDGVLCSHKNLEKCMEMEDFPCISGKPDPSATQEGEDVFKHEILDVLPPEVEVWNLLAANGFSSTCEDYLLDIECAENITDMDYESNGGLHLENLESESDIPGFNIGENGTIGISDLSTVVIPVPESQNDMLDETSCKLHGISSGKCKCETSVEDKWLKYHTSFDLQNINKLEDVSSPLIQGISSDKDDMVFPGGTFCASTIKQNNEVSPVGRGVARESLHRQDVLKQSSGTANNVVALAQKRLRKPTRRYIDESSDLNSRYCTKRLEVSASISKDKFLGVRFHKHHHMESRAIRLFAKKSSGKAIQVPFDSREQKECWKKHEPVVALNSYEETSPAESGDDCIATVISEEHGGRRKHHRPWSVSEVRKLIDGVSSYGVGRWAHIKRQLFSLSAHRSAVDLKDKWRNLLKASGVQKQVRKEDEHKRNHGLRSLPKSVLRRVSELDILYPYPRDRKSKLSCIPHAASSPIYAARRSAGVSMSRSRRDLLRKICN